MLIASTALGQGQGPANVRVAAVVQRDVQTRKTFAGTVMPARRVVVGSAVDGRVDKFPVNEGDAVKAGQPLCQLLTKTIDIEVAASEANRDLRRHELEEMENGARPEEKRQVEARAAAAQAIMNYAKSRLVRIKELQRKGSSTPEELDNAMSAAEEAIKLFDAATATRELTLAGPRPEQIAQAKARLAVAEQELERQKDIQKKYTIVAPFDGFVSVEQTEMGAWLTRGDPVAEIVELAEVEVSVMVLEDFSANLRTGLAADVVIGALPREKFNGQIAHVVPQADLKSRSFPVKVRVKNKIEGGVPQLKSGMFAHVTLPVGETKSALLVPRDAIVLGLAKPLVYVVDRASPDAPSGKLRAVQVTPQMDAEEFVAVEGGVKPGELVVVEGNERLRPGQDAIIVK